VPGGDPDVYSDFVFRRRKGRMCAECGLVNWLPDRTRRKHAGPIDWTAPREIYVRVPLEDLENLAEQIPRIPNTWKPGLVTCSPSLYVARHDLSRSERRTSTARASS
jgi:hypothetical protein